MNFENLHVAISEKWKGCTMVLEASAWRPRALRCYGGEL